MTRLFAGVRHNWKYVLGSTFAGALFWFLQFLYHALLESHHIELSFLHSFAFSGATLITLSLLIGPIARLFPKYNYIKHRRTCGVLGFTLAIFHVVNALSVVFRFNVLQMLSILSPYQNPVIFGVVAFIIFIPLYITSTDWATTKLGYNRWKTIHRLTYVAWFATVLHFLLIDPPILFNLSGYLLILLSSAVMGAELAAFYLFKKNAKSTWVGLGIFALGVLLFGYAVLTNPNDMLLAFIVLSFVLFLIFFFLAKKPATKTHVITPAVPEPASPSLE